MKRTLLLIAIALMSVSCNREFCQKNYPCSDSVSYIERLKLDTSYLYLPSDTSYIELPVDCPDQQIVYRDGKQEIIYRIKDRILTVNQVTFADSIRIINQFKQSSDFKQYEKPVEVEVPFIPKWIKYLLMIESLLLIWNYRKYILGAIKFVFGRFF